MRTSALKHRASQAGFTVWHTLKIFPKNFPYVRQTSGQNFVYQWQKACHSIRMRKFLCMQLLLYESIVPQALPHSSWHLTDFRPQLRPSCAARRSVTSRGVRRIGAVDRLQYPPCWGQYSSLDTPVHILSVQVYYQPFTWYMLRDLILIIDFLTAYTSDVRYQRTFDSMRNLT